MTVSVEGWTTADRVGASHIPTDLDITICDRKMRGVAMLHPDIIVSRWPDLLSWKDRGMFRDAGIDPTGKPSPPPKLVSVTYEDDEDED